MFNDMKKKPVVTGGKGAEKKGQPGAKGPTGVTPPTKIGAGGKKTEAKAVGKKGK